MFGKRGETPPLPRNCERARPLQPHRSPWMQPDDPTEAARRREGKRQESGRTNRV